MKIEKLPMKFNEDKSQVEVNGTRIHLTPFEYGVLQMLYRVPAPVTEQEMLFVVWGITDPDVDTRCHERVISTLRKKLGKENIVTVTVSRNEVSMRAYVLRNLCN